MFLTYILPILLFIYIDGDAHPVYQSPASNMTSFPSLAVIDSDAQYRQRSLFGVAWGCILTVFICAWTSVHPNVPPRGPMGALLARVKLMFWTIVAPELVLAWAVRQWFAAREIKEIYNQHVGNRPLKTWTTTHGHFLEMGGFKLVSDKIHKLEGPGPEQPGWLSTTADWDPYAEYVGQRERCQLGTLTVERFKELIGDPDVVFPDITPAQIKDRSKGDGLSKLLAILQTSWFILQCVARGSQDLALTEIELVTLAMASLNGITFAFWWSKPLSVQEPVDVYVTVRGVVAEEVPRHKDEETEGDVKYTAPDVISKTWRWHSRPGEGFLTDWYLHLLPIAEPIYLFCLLIYPVFLTFPLGVLLLLWAIETEKVEKVLADETVATRVVLSLRKLRYRLTHSIRRFFGGQDGPLGNIFSTDRYFLISWFCIIPASFFLLALLLLILSPLFAIFFIASFIFTGAFEIVTTNRVTPGATHVPAFYAPRTKSDNYSRMIVFAIFGVIFGGIHCIAWNFAFPTHTERSLWRYTSLVLTVIPLVAAPIDFILENVELNGTVGKRLQIVLAIFMTALLSLYVPARLSLILQALALLRDQPDSAYVAVKWTKYIPHLFSS